MLSGSPSPPIEKKKPIVTDLQEITGFYHVRGTIAAKPYSGIVKIWKIQSVYIVQWVTDTSPVIVVGLRNGSPLAVGWQQTDIVG
ncbi:MAG: hypothetical protein AAB538_02835, partial [Patescibacteria group bacterium]